MTIRLYYDDPYSRDFDATVVSVAPRDGRHAVTLDRSSFYPTSGGQPFDTGTLGDARVVDVVDEDGEVVHVVEGGMWRAGDAVHGQIDWGRRFDHMQQHTGQHMLSAAFVRSSQAATVSFHLGGETSTIDLATELSGDAIGRAEALANTVVWEDRPIEVRYAESAEAADMGLRKHSKRTGTLRLVDIADFDLSACGGSHVTSTARVGAIVVCGWERFKGGMRVEFACGGRAVRRHTMLRDAVQASVRQLSVLPGELPEAIERTLAEQRQLKKLLSDQALSLASHRAEALAAAAEPVAGGRLVLSALDVDSATLRQIASALTTRSGYMVVLIGTLQPMSVVAARASDAPLDCNILVRALCTRYGGRGGGRPDMAQAGGLIGSVDDILAEARRLANA
jgi:alanyl-tRNA synthetase